MGFVVKPSNKNNYRLVEEIWTPERKEKTVPIQGYMALGFDPNWTIEDARKRASQINLQNRLEAQKIAAAVRVKVTKDLINTAYLPSHLVQSFESELDENHSDNPKRLKNLMQHWRAAQLIVSTLELDPKDFHSERRKIFNHYRSKKWAPDYIKKLNSILNLWGTHCAKINNSFFLAIPKLSSTDVERISNLREDIEGRKTTADPLKWTDLKNKKSAFETDGLILQWNWLFIGLFFGLRPKEVDSLVNQKNWKIEWNEQNKVDVLMIYQSKLSSLSKEKRWKPIPITFEEQKEALKLIKNGEFKRPLNKTIQRILEGQIETYSPRKGFADLMLERGFGLEDISIFLGHSDINMTWRHYKDKFTFKLPKTG